MPARTRLRAPCCSRDEKSNTGACREAELDDFCVSNITEGGAAVAGGGVALAAAAAGITSFRVILLEFRSMLTRAEQRKSLV